MTSPTIDKRPINTPRQVLFASLVGTAVEFFDFYIYATAAVLEGGYSNDLALLIDAFLSAWEKAQRIA